MNQQKLSFQAGKRHVLDNIYEWIWRQQEGGSRVTTMDILSYLQNELDYDEEPSMSPRAASQQQHPQPTMQFMNSSFMVSSGSSGQTVGQGTHPGHCDQQSKNLVFSNALSSPVGRSLQHYHIAQEGYCPNSGVPSGNGVRNNEPSFLQNQTRDSNPHSSSDTLMDMHADSPSHESTY
ncbi:exocyst complex component 2-like [Hibiscus syriacus]|uniref:Exocyst complex component 2-like n=1 Tax=Hibiscus syriacus TaxID=106335 RepID=A0A6A2YSI7_HIBSY|nr:exocyst complex component 2-like [Hibiscus syriacus]